MDRPREYRLSSKVIACFDIVVTVLALFLYGMGTIGLGVIQHAANNPNGTVYNRTMSHLNDDQVDQITNDAWFFYVTFAILIIASVIQLWAAVRLFRATEIGKEAQEALRLAKFWRSVTIIFLVVNVISDLLRGYFISAAFSVVIRGVFLFLVHKFILGLQEETK